MARRSARRSHRSCLGQRAARPELSLEIDSALAIVDRRHARRFGRAHVGDRVVDEQQVARAAPDALEQDLEDPWVGFGDPDTAGDDADVEFAQEIVLLLDEREGLMGEVAQRVNRSAGPLQAPQERDILFDRPADRLDPPLVEQPQLGGEFRISLRLGRDRLGEIRGDVGARDEVHAAGGAEKALHPRFVGEDVAEQPAPVPAQENVADVEDDDQGGRPEAVSEGRATLPRFPDGRKRRAPAKPRLRRAEAFVLEIGSALRSSGPGVYLAMVGQIGDPMPIYSIAKAKDNLSKLVDEAVAGQEVAITRHGKVVAYLRSAAERPIRQPPHELVREILAFAKKRPLEEPGVDIIRRMRDGEAG